MLAQLARKPARTAAVFRTDMNHTSSMDRLTNAVQAVRMRPAAGPAAEDPAHETSRPRGRLLKIKDVAGTRSLS